MLLSSEMPFGNEEESEEMKETVLHVAAANFTTYPVAFIINKTNAVCIFLKKFEKKSLSFLNDKFFQKMFEFFGPKINQNVAI